MSKPKPKADYDYVKIKDVYIELDDYNFYHSPVDPSRPSSNFIGRQGAKAKIKTLLSNTENPSGCYLVTGFRGMGKTSTVREAIRELNPKSTKGKVPSPKKYSSIDIALSQTDIQELDILRQLARQIYLQWLSIYGPLKVARQVFRLIVITLTALATFAFLIDQGIIWDNWTDFWISLVGQKGSLFQPDSIIKLGRSFYLFVFAFDLMFFSLIAIRTLIQINSSRTRKVSISHHNIHDRLENLNARLNARVLQERAVKMTPQAGLNIGFLKNLNLNYSRLGPITYETKKQLSYEIATPKEIEKELILILDKIHDLRCQIMDHYWKRFFLLMSRRKIPWFIIIIDELDKIEPDHLNSKVDSLSFPDPETLSQQRQRQEAVARLLANLKSFLNTAKAKFIFIGGREMFDAALADVSDRESFYSSIFSSVINIESFFKDKLLKHAGVTGMTEAFICRAITPKEFHMLEEGSPPDKENIEQRFHVSPDNLVKYYKVLSTVLTISGSNDEHQLAAKKRKVIFLLQSFIIFLTYRSNGSPKRLIELFEQYIVSENSILSDPEQRRNEGSNIVIRTPSEYRKNGTSNLFLRFGFIKQYEISFTSNLYRPYIILNSRHMKQLDDKLLYSSAFILDHILKFHRHAFSWRNIELIPDIILVNKDPNLRFFIEDKLQFLFSMHIRETVNSIFQYKFYSKVSHELKLLSKVSELSSAAFNFTLDESYHIKAWYKKNLQVKMQEYQSFDQVLGAGGYVHAVGYLKNILGDLHYYDREYDEAIIYYTGVVQPLRTIMNEDGQLSNHQIALYVRTKLKIGLCLEKIKLHDSAYSIYRTLILNGRRLVGKARQQEKSNQLSDEDNERRDEKIFRIKWEKPYRRMQLFLRPHIALLDLIEKQRADGVTSSNLERNIQEYCRFLEIDNRFPAITPEQEKVLDNRRTDRKRIQTLLADYYNNVGSILFFKNKNFLRLHAKAMEGSFGQFFSDRFKKPQYNLYNFTSQIYSRNSRSLATRDFYPTLSAVIYYEKGLQEILLPYQKNLQNESGSQHNIFQTLTTVIQEPYVSIFNATVLYFIANLLNKMGDAILSCVSETSSGGIEEALLESFLMMDSGGKLPIISKHLTFAKKVLPNTYFKINRVIAVYHLAALFYQRAGREYSFAFQYKKVLYVLKDYLTFFKSRTKTINQLCHFCLKNNGTGESHLENFATKIFKSITATSNISNRPQMEKFHEVFGYLDDGRRTPLDYEKVYVNLSTSPEVREVILLVEEIKLKIYRLSSNSKSASFDSSRPANLPKVLLGSYDLISSMYCRMLELKYRSEYNWWVLNKHMKDFIGKNLNQLEQSTENNSETKSHSSVKELLKDAMTKHYNYMEDRNSIKEFFIQNITMESSDLHQRIADSIFCLWEASRIFKNYETSYITNYSFQGNAYYKLGNWIELYNKYKTIQEWLEKKPAEKVHHDIKTELSILIGPAASGLMDQYFFNEMAIQSYEKAIQLHRQGKAYKDLNAKMHFLEDDYNDNLTHFSAATERFRLNIGVVRQKISSLRKAVEDGSWVYQYDKYFQEGDLLRKVQSPK